MFVCVGGVWWFAVWIFFQKNIYKTWKVCFKEYLLKDTHHQILSFPHPLSIKKSKDLLSVKPMFITHLGFHTNKNTPLWHGSLTEPNWNTKKKSKSTEFDIFITKVCYSISNYCA